MIRAETQTDLIRVDDGERGEQGIQGIQGIQGQKGQRGEKGQQGIQGIQGEQGIQGIQGEKGQQGIQGQQGVSVRQIQPQYYLSTSDVDTIGGSWNTSLNYVSGKYIWTRDYITYSDNSHTTSTPIYHKALTQSCQNSEDAIDDITEHKQYFWHDGQGAHILGDSLGYRNDITSTGMTIVDTNGGINIAQFGSNGTQIGKLSGAHSVIDANGQRFYGGNSGSLLLANIGYGEGKNQSGTTSLAPYFTFGQKEANTTVGNYAVGEGYRFKASGWASHAEGYYTHADGAASHSEGDNSVAIGENAHAEGYNTLARGEDSHAQNTGTIAYSNSQTAIGKYNISDVNDTYALIVGNGTSDAANERSNALTVAWNGDIESAGDITDGSGNTLSSKADTTAIPTNTSDLNNDSDFVSLTSSKPLFKVVSVKKTFTVNANSYAQQSFAPSSSQIPSGYTRVGVASWNTASTHVFIANCTNTTIVVGNKASSTQTCTNATIDWLYIRSSL